MEAVPAKPRTPGRQAVIHKLHFSIAKVDQVIGHLNREREQVRHGPLGPIFCNEFAAQEDEPSALSVDWLACTGKFREVREKPCLLAQGRSVKFGIATAKIERIKIGWQTSVGKRAEFHDVRTLTSQFIQAGFV